MTYLISYHLRSNIDGLSAKEAKEHQPLTSRVAASNATRAISSLVNDLKATGDINSKGDVIILEAKVVA